MLRRQRELIRGCLTDPEERRHNENALSGIYEELGATGAANAAHGRAMDLAGPDAPPEVVARLHVNLASMQWTARVPPDLKEATDAYATRQGVTLTAAVTDLLERGLAAASDSRSVDQLDARLRTAEAQLATLTALAERADHRIGDCPKCGKEITGRDLLAVGSCPHSVRA